MEPQSGVGNLEKLLKQMDNSASLEPVRKFFEDVPSAIAMFDREMRYLLVTRRWLQDYRLEKRDLSGLCHYEVFPEIPEEWREAHRRGMQGERLESTGDEFKREDGSVQWIKWVLRPWHRENGEVGGIILVTEDITSRKQIESELISNEEQYRTMFVGSSLGKALIDPQTGLFLKVNPALCRFLGREEQQLQKMTFAEAADPAIRDVCLQGLRDLQQRKHSAFQAEKRFLRPDGSFVWGSFTLNLVHDSDGTPQYALAAIQDISKRKAVEAELAVSERKYRQLIESANSIILRWDNQGILRFVNEFGCRFFGYAENELIGQEVRILLTGEQQRRSNDVADLIQDVLEHPEQHKSVISENRCKDGRTVWVTWTNKAILDAQDNVAEILAIGNDITPQKTAEKALRTSERSYRLLNRSMIQPLALHEIICDDSGVPIDYRFLNINPAFEKLIGMTAEEVVGRTVLELFPETEPIWIENYGRVALTGEPMSFDHYFKTLKRHFEVIVYSPMPQQFAVLATDITGRLKIEEERRRLEEQMFHTQKLESLGVLAGGIAHDFNNILMSVLGNANLALRRMSHESPAAENVQQIEIAAGKAADLARQMLAYSGKGRFVIEPINLNSLVQEMLHILQVSISKQAVLRFNPSRNLPAVEADATQLRQVVMNLVINASEAISDKSGVIAITTGAMDCDHAYLDSAYLDQDLEEGLYVFFEVADTGCGMDQETLRSLFDPFFSTKFTGRGLGMAAVLGIVRGHRGAIKVYSEPDRGSSFKILLPASVRPESLYDKRANNDGWKGSGTVLLVDDEETVRAIGKDMLNELGFNVITASDGRDALDLYRSHREIISCVLMDLTMPHMDGEQAYRELRRIDPEVKIAMASGYNEEEVCQKFLGKGMSGFIQKPYRLSELISLMQQLEKSEPG